MNLMIKETMVSLDQIIFIGIIENILVEESIVMLTSIRHGQIHANLFHI